MDELKKEMDTVFKLISAVPVTGEGVDIMAAAREHLRHAYQLLEQKEANDGG